MAADVIFFIFSTAHFNEWVPFFAQPNFFAIASIFFYFHVNSMCGLVNPHTAPHAHTDVFIGRDECVELVRFLSTSEGLTRLKLHSTFKQHIKIYPITLVLITFTCGQPDNHVNMLVAHTIFTALISASCSSLKLLELNFSSQ
jgi:hypothetical protein